MTAKSSHLQGASALLETRGVNVSKCVLGRKGLYLFLHFRSQLVKHSDYVTFIKSNTKAVDKQPAEKPTYS
jgi:hypothetical protein